jgi:membrane-associated HD superfamily phosphohydrolase
MKMQPKSKIQRIFNKNQQGVMMMKSERTTPSNGSRFGYFISILINGVIYYVINNIPIWNYIPFLNEQYRDVLWIANISLGVTVFMFATFLVFDPRWYRSLMQAVSNFFSFYSIEVFRQVFPLDITNSAAHWVNIGLLILMAIMILSTISELASAVRHYRQTHNE